MEIKNENYRIENEDYLIEYDAQTMIINCQGSLRLSGMEEYAPLVEFFQTISEQKSSQITLDLRQLRFLNSSGINVLSKFVIKIREIGESQMIIQGDQKIPWQQKSLKNLKRLMPSLELKLE